MEIKELIIKLVFIVGITVLIIYSLLNAAYGDEKKRKARNFFRRNQDRNEQKRQRPNNRFNYLVIKDKILARVLPGILSLLMLSLLIFVFVNNYKPLVNEVANKPEQEPSPPAIIINNTPEQKPIYRRPEISGTIGGEKIYYQTDRNGKRHYTNSILKRNETTSERETPIIIRSNNSILIQVTIGHNGEAIQAYMMLDTGCGRTLIHQPIIQQLQPDTLGNGQSTVADGRKIETTIVKFDFIKVGPFTEKNLIASTSQVENANQLDYYGLLGMDFLKKHPFQIDIKRHVVRWM